MLDLHPDTGLAALEACGLTSEFWARSVECGEAVVVADKDGAVLWSMEDAGGPQPEISRHALTRLLLSKLLAGCIRWEHGLASARSSIAPGSSGPGHQYTLRFDDRSEGRDLHAPPDVEVTADLVVGADGAWSRTWSSLLEAHKPACRRGSIYSGVQMITLDVADLTTRRPELSALVSPGSFIALGGRLAWDEGDDAESAAARDQGHASRHCVD